MPPMRTILRRCGFAQHDLGDRLTLDICLFVTGKKSKITALVRPDNAFKERIEMAGVCACAGPTALVPSLTDATPAAVNDGSTQVFALSSSSMTSALATTSLHFGYESALGPSTRRTVRLSQLDVPFAMIRKNPCSGFNSGVHNFWGTHVASDYFPNNRAAIAIVYAQSKIAEKLIIVPNLH
ncbi:uncharacterized protein BT62DRAFT_1075306 [Guyanagaster necrorhizus]|uniref:Uncharacterized protein n=1 Tax=Guyanagaster necrorhizus TaxID=856835 RepID=A0A9P7VV78_9AGAR|nr:uncharacterized protein BT62DRAFT_1075306 [Guyanagaster necrorhizus MCA 3950]KAG7447218.1 hypothetical protein BT62DRAFT_1075306 [Guyanagaster necrorhizus MCA 3950]